MSGREDHKPTGQAEILPFRARLKPEPAKPVRNQPSFPEEDSVEPLSAAALVKIGILVLFLVVAGVWLANKLREIGIKEDCVMQGRKNCVTISVPNRNP